MPDYTSISNFPLKVIFLAHFLLISLSCMGHWSPTAYGFYNFLLLVLLLWALHNKQSEDPIQLAFAVNGVSVVLDIFILSFCYPDSHQAQERFSAAIAIIHLIVRPFSTIYLLKVLRERMGDPAFMGNLFPAGPSESYEDIDRNATNNQPTHNSYDFSTAQQI